MNALARIDRCLAQHMPSTPCVIIDLETVRQRCMALQALLPDARDLLRCEGQFRRRGDLCAREPGYRL